MIKVRSKRLEVRMKNGVSLIDPFRDRILVENLFGIFWDRIFQKQIYHLKIKTKR